ncbi:arylamine N-acetyltransferase family protein [Kribbella deserti]|uniref:Arylamine N-acetyltransferase n=1 Tax=Kribbella deserti TaxID=1926257 RepID=A0ABV6QKP3_9ACTN
MTNWEIEKVQLDAYLARIGHPRVQPSAAALGSLHAAHVAAIPFENVDVILRQHPGITLDAIAAKLIGRRRGGYCYEHGLLFAAALEQLGFTVHRRQARVQPHRNGPRTHMMLHVATEAGAYLADVGFGAGMMHAMPLTDGAIVNQAGWPHRLDLEDTPTGPAWTLSKQTPDGWEPQHRHDLQPQRLIDYEVSHHYVSSHPDSPFSHKLVVMRLEEGLSRRLIGNELTHEYADGRRKTETVRATDLPDVLASLDVELTSAEARAISQLEV